MVAGDSAEQGAVARQVEDQGLTDVVLTGRVDRRELDGLLAGSAATVHPAAWFETAPSPYGRA